MKQLELSSMFTTFHAPLHRLRERGPSPADLGHFLGRLRPTISHDARRPSRGWRCDATFRAVGSHTISIVSVFISNGPFHGGGGLLSTCPTVHPRSV